ncbi:hypothetical protein EDB81DRAFT_635024 [Dactylonectria macrodidyma]|uniref:FAD-binding PCMH-type domain-containing protein n=1 Tax=Dactylonectria macrodidyma TaxID=307937 RepID=A0A9P9FSC9_9HYPO|nr:hypothetical protein EDB81DRAFT_635024 [Dactylonectria macrodidyma]
MATSCQSRQRIVETLFQQYPKIPYAVPHSPDYGALRATFIVDNPAVPIAIARPQNAEDVSVIVSFCVSHGVPFVVRSGGNNLFGKSQVQDALTIDMRDIKYCHVNDGQSYAKVGGGILAGTLVEALSKAGVMTASGMVHFIGYFGWAAYGGYGPFSGNFGYGFEQIIGAKVVNWKGDILDADQELLKGIRGAGGSFGIVVEITIAVRPLTEVLTGFIQYDANNVEATVTSYCRGVQELRATQWPGQLSVAPMFLCTPDGLKLLSHFMWSDDNESVGLEWRERVSKLGETICSAVRKTTILDGMSDFNSTIPLDGRGSVNTINLRSLTDESIAVMATYVQSMPRYVGNGFAIHIAPMPSKTTLQESVFGATEPHYMLEILATPRLEEGLEESRRWEADFIRELLRTESENILPTTYINHTPPGRTTLKQIFGVNFPFVLALKQKYDPNNVFNLAVPFSYIPLTNTEDMPEINEE